MISRRLFVKNSILGVALPVGLQHTASAQTSTSVSVETLNIAQARVRLKQGAYVLLMRHAQTEPGTGDPPGFTLGECSTQRNLSEEGREYSRRLGLQLNEGKKAKSDQLLQVFHSEWCRCEETARLAFAGSAPINPWSALNSFFEDRTTEAKQTALVKKFIAELKLEQGQRVVLVTHQVNISAITNQFSRMGEVLALTAGTKSQLQFRFSLND